MQTFKSPKKSIGDLDASVASSVISASSDIALIVDRKGIIRDLTVKDQDGLRDIFSEWVGKAFVDTVSIDSRTKVEELLNAAVPEKLTPWRQVNHLTDKQDLPVRYAAMRLDAKSGRTIVFGRELSSLAQMQQRLVSTQMSMEREYAKLRADETRYRALFQLTSEALLIADGATLRITDANPAAVRLLERGARPVAGRQLADLFDAQSAARIKGLIERLGVSSDCEPILISRAGDDQGLSMSASLLRQSSATSVLVKLSSAQASDGEPAAGGPAQSSMLSVVDVMPDGFVVVDTDRRILTANTAFLELTQLATEEQARRLPIGTWLGRVDVDVDILFASLRENETVARFSTVVRGQYGATTDVELSGVAVRGGKLPCFGLIVRRAAPRQAIGAGATPMPLTRSADQLTGLVGRVPLKELVRETTDIIERMCIETALQLTNDNRASAAEMLGLSRQSLYVKMRRHGLGDGDE